MGQESYLKIGGGMGSLPYEGTLGWHAELQYEYRFLPSLSGFVSVGINGDNFTNKGQSQGNDGMETWNNSWEYNYVERLNYIDLGLKYPLLSIGKRYVMKPALGLSFVQSVLEYPEKMFINRGVIEQREDVVRKVGAGMLLFGLENVIALNERVGLNLSLNYRTAFTERHILTREVTFHNSRVTSTSGILHVTNIVLQIGYRF
jgi:hypothetical protein